MRKPIVVILLRHYLPGFKSGGPIRSVANLVKTLGDEIDFRIICRDRDANDTQPYKEIESGPWLPGDGARICYLPDAELRPWRVISRLRELEYDLLYLNSFFEPRFAIVPMLGHRFQALRCRRVLLAPRGEFSPGALQIKRTKKWAYIRAIRALAVGSGLTFHATSMGEVEDIRRELPPRQEIFLAPNIPTLGRLSGGASPDKVPGEISMVFLSRISVKKNLIMALRIVSRLPCRIWFDIWGPIGDDHYWRRCQAEISRAPANVRIRYCGPVTSAEVPNVLGRYHVLFLPTMGENFGHAIFEAMANGLPVVISDQTPWRDLGSHRVGFDVALDDEAGFLRALTHYVDMDAAALNGARHACVRFASDWIDANDLKSRSRKMFDAVLAMSPN